MRTAACLMHLAAIASLACAAPSWAQEIRSVRKRGLYEDVKFDLQNAIIKRGLVVDYNPRISTMLERTGPDVGSDQPIYATAEYMTFCSAALSRKSMEADPLNIGFCPYVIFLYEAAGRSGEIVIGYRAPAPPARASKATRTALGAVDKLLGEIIRDAAK